MNQLRAVPKTAWLLSALSGILQVLIFPKASWTPLAWVALAPLLAALLRVPNVEVFGPDDSSSETRALLPAQGFWLGYLCGVVWYAGSCYWIFNTMRQYGGLSSVVSALMLLLFSLYLGLYHGLFGALLVRAGRSATFSGTRALAVAPFLWVAVELLRSRITGFPWDLLGNSVVDNLPLTRMATVTGIYGLSFVITLVNTLFAATLLVRPGKRLKFGLIAVASAAVLHAGTFIKLPALEPTHTARLVQENVPIFENGAWSADYYDQTISSIVDLSRARMNSQAAPAPRLIIWPESPAPFYVNDPKFRTWISTLASDRDSFIIAGSLGTETPQTSGEQSRIFNSAVLVGPSGAFLSRYDKIHLVPFGEYVPFQPLLFFAEKLTKEVGTFSRGAERKVFPLVGGSAQISDMPDMPEMQPPHAQSSTSPALPGDANKVGVFICYESIFGDEVRQFAENGAQVFVNISNDGWYGDSSAPSQLLSMSRMRAIENNRWLLRATNTGTTASIDPYGRVLASADRNVRTALDAPYAFVTGTTFYTRHGDWFAYACAIISLMALFVRLNFRAGFIRSR